MGHGLLWRGLVYGQMPMVVIFMGKCPMGIFAMGSCPWGSFVWAKFAAKAHVVTFLS